MRMVTRNRERGETSFGLIIGIALAIVATVAAFKIIPLHIHGNDVLDAMQEASNFGSLKATEKLQYDVFTRAQEAGVPLTLEQIKVYKRGTYIVIEAKYTQTTDVFGYKYVYNFDKTVEKPVF